VANEQFGKFVEVIKKLYVNIPLLDAMQVPTYAKYIKDILGNKRALPTIEVVQLTEECSAAILDPLLVKKKDPGCTTITCSIRAQHFSNALCDLGASVSVMPKVVYDKLNHHALAPTAMCLQLADQTVRYPRGNSREYSGENPEFLHSRRLRRPRHGSRHQDASHHGQDVLEYSKWPY
jgi:hypothetical protein